MTLNKSQLLIIGAIVSAFLGVPDINKVFTEEVINLVMQNPSPMMIFLVSITKILLTLSVFGWIAELIKNMEFTYRNKSNAIFQCYLFKLVITAIVTFLVMMFIKNKIL